MRLCITGDVAEFEITCHLRVNVSVAIYLSIFTDKRKLSSIIFVCVSVEATQQYLYIRRYLCWWNGIVCRRNVQYTT